jgi:hypothetical protein
MQNFDALQSIVETIIPTLKRVFESENERQKAAQDKELAELKMIMADTRDTNMRVFKIVMNMQQHLPPQIDRQQPIYFIDACGEHAPFHLEFINSWEAFEAVLEVRFKDKGFSKIRRREYILERPATRTALNRNSPWGRGLLPGSTITMDMVFDVPSQTVNSCPVCGHESVESMESEIDW